jgi:hypothetical protein
MFSAGFFGLGSIKYKKPGNEDAGSDSFSDHNTESSSKSKSRASEIFKSISSSIPSQLCKPIKKHSMDSSRYEVRIEPRAQETDHSPVEQLDPILSVQKSSLDSPDSCKQKSPPATLTSPKDIARPGKTKSCTLPPSMSLVNVPVKSPVELPERKNSSPFVTMTEAAKVPAPDITNPKLAFPHSSSFNQPAFSTPPTSPEGIVEPNKVSIPESSSAGSIKNINSNKEMWYRNPSSYLNRHASYRSAANNKDLSFKKPSEVSAAETKFSKPPPDTTKKEEPMKDVVSKPALIVNKSEPATKPEVTAPKPAIKAAKPSISTSVKSSKPSSSSTSPTSSTTTGVSSTKPVTTLTLSPFAQNSSTTSTSGSGSADSSKPVVKRTLWSVMDGDKPKSEEKPLVQIPAVESTERQKTPVIVDKVTNTGKSPKDKKVEKQAASDKVEAPSNNPIVKSPEKDKEVGSLLGTQSASEQSLASQASSGACAPGLTKPTISRPVLQTATPSAASLIAKAPSTGVSQSSILSGKEKESDPFKPPKEKGRRAIFCDPITLPSPTSPNNPPIIHQPTGGPQAPVEPTSPPLDPARYNQAIITPIWSTQPQPTQVQVEECDLGGNSPTKQAEKSTLSKLISNVKRTPSMSGQKKSKDEGDNRESLSRKTSRAGSKGERSSIRNLEISSPVLQSAVDTRNLVPVSRSQDVQPDQSSRLSSPEPAVPVPPQRGSSNTNKTSGQGSPVTKRQAPKPPPAKPMRSPDAIKPTTAKTPPKVDDIMIKSKQRYQPFSSSAQQRNAQNTSTWEAKPPKASSSDDSLDSKKDSSAPSSRQRRPVSIATSKPNRPTAPPPKPPPSSRGSSGSTSPDDSYLLSNGRVTSQTTAGSQISAPLAVTEPIYDTITEEPEAHSKNTSGKLKIYFIYHSLLICVQSPFI